MPFRIEWYIPYRVISVHAEGHMNHDDFAYYSDSCVQLLTEALEHAPNKKVINFFDSTEAKSYLPIYMMISRGIPVMRFKNRGPLFHVTRNPTIKSIQELTAHVMGFPLRTFTDRDAAIAAINKAIAREDMLTSGNSHE